MTVIEVLSVLTELVHRRTDLPPGVFLPVRVRMATPDLVAFVTSHFLVDKGSLLASEDAWRSPPTDVH